MNHPYKIAGFFVHTVLCIQPIIYKRIMEEGQFELADAVLEKYYKAVLPPFLIGYGFTGGNSLCDHCHSDGGVSSP